VCAYACERESACKSDRVTGIRRARAQQRECAGETGIVSE